MRRIMSTSDPLADWDYELPPELVAARPTEVRSAARLLVAPLDGGPPEHRTFADLPTLLRPGDLLVANDSRVMYARLRARRRSRGAVQLLLLEAGPGPVRALCRPARRLSAGEELLLDGGHTARLLTAPADGEVLVELDVEPERIMAELGEVPLPPYLDRAATDEDRNWYQTVYAGPLGSAAAPTAGLHFDDAVLDALKARGIGFATVTLHVGPGTFRPIDPAALDRGALHAEHYAIPAATVEHMRQARDGGGRIVAVGTTTTRALEAATPLGAHLPTAGPGTTSLFVRPPYTFRAIDGLLTNFHLPRSSLLLLVGALAGRERLLDLYALAVRERYRFYSYGDAMLLV
jgi:S-adenosylmethionine:tRNA ribosyltransferase-isomerase